MIAPVRNTDRPIAPAREAVFEAMMVDVDQSAIFFKNAKGEWEKIADLTSGMFMLMGPTVLYPSPRKA